LHANEEHMQQSSSTPPSRRVNSWALISLGVAILVVLAAAIIAASTVFVPDSNPAYETALTFARAVSEGDTAAAEVLMHEDLLAYTRANCPDASVARCIQDAIPAGWGEFLNVVFRRAAPDGPASDVDLIATYEFAEGGSGVCIYVRVEPAGDAAYAVTAYAGWIHCGDPASRNMAANPAAPNRAPAQP
jgi:hypothetical protein